MKVRGVGFVEAVETLLSGAASPGWHSPPPPAEKPKKAFALPLPNKNSHRAAAYLMGRGISLRVIRYCLRAGTLYESAKHHNCVFVGKDAEGTPRFACMRATSGDYKKDIPGSDKRYSFSVPTRDSPALYVFEAPVDLLSLATIRSRKDPEGWADVHCLSLGGVSARALEQYISDHPGVENIALCLDNDPPGREATGKLRASLEAKGYAALDILPPSGKDWNQHLQNVTQRDKTAQQSRPKDAAISI